MQAAQAIDPAACWLSSLEVHLESEFGLTLKQVAMLVKVDMFDHNRLPNCAIRDAAEKAGKQCATCEYPKMITATRFY